jgi:hypothetical protein
LEELKGKSRILLKLLMDGRISDYHGESESEHSDSIRSAQRNENCGPCGPGGDQEAFLKFAAEFRSVNMATASRVVTPDRKKRVQTFLFEAGLSYPRKPKV